ncbi:prenylated flavin chaperone LpdD [Caldithrix abyssi]|uniref:Prenylated flavin chaperone LpdD-like domain-containing protein n=1 Tax=Caldithrix abyssi DSM 13497 TaxID=880073 RepID=H1XXS6_CALAY|nr:hypothetical protein [Caldithrix abyssi]APF19628.1 hypothetical protein Cabys_2880 [Caldithrix abyssi DSM 13497]EHO39749.1 hypothetical protein Calab_0095 [Caldithrix abyssi DSM 13497]
MFNKPFVFRKNEVELNAFFMGEDLIVAISGGEAHLGAVAVGMCYGADHKKSSVSLIGLPGHQEDVLIFPIARRLSKALQTNVCVMAGIHFDQLTGVQIMDIVQTAEDLTDQLINAIRQTKK